MNMGAVPISYHTNNSRSVLQLQLCKPLLEVLDFFFISDFIPHRSTKINKYQISLSVIATQKTSIIKAVHLIFPTYIFCNKFQTMFSETPLKTNKLCRFKTDFTTVENQFREH